MSMSDMLAYYVQKGIDEGMVKGMKKGMKKGIEEGKQYGKINATLSHIKHLMKNKHMEFMEASDLLGVDDGMRNKVLELLENENNVDKETISKKK